MPKLLFTESYNKKAAKFLKKHSELKNQYQKTLELLVLNPTHPTLRLHKLKGKFDDLYSVSINLNYRILLIFLIIADKIIPVDIGSHSDIY